MFDLKEKVVCIDDSFVDGIHDYYNALPQKGKIYTVRDIIPAWGFDLQETPAVLLEELVNKPNKHGIEPAFQIHRFRELDSDEVAEYAEETEDLEVCV